MVSSPLDNGRGQASVLQWQHQRFILVTAFWVMGEVRHDFTMTAFTLDSVPAPITDYFLADISLPNTLLGAIEDTCKEWDLVPSTKKFQFNREDQTVIWQLGNSLTSVTAGLHFSIVDLGIYFTQRHGFLADRLIVQYQQYLEPRNSVC